MGNALRDGRQGIYKKISEIVNVRHGCRIAFGGLEMWNRMQPRSTRLYLAAGLLGLIGVNAMAAPERSTPATVVPLSIREQKMWREPVHASEFANVGHTSAKSQCENTQAPEALTTPEPVLDKTDADVRIRVSFIVGTDGRVHSPLILESRDGAGIENVLATVRSWRYRPATCNGAPTESEGRIAFSNR